MSSTEQPKYALGQGVYSSPRLDLQYTQIVQALGGHIIDPIIPYNKPGLTIADVCCGTGFFFANINTDPSTELHAFDIDLSKLPPETFLPNIKRHVWNINEPPPAEYLSTFDIVNVQLTFTFVPDITVDKVFRNILSLVKPGGHIQWMESQMIDQKIISPDPNYTPQFLPKVFDMGFDLYTAPMPTWPKILDEVFTRNRVEILKTDRALPEPRHYKAWTMQQCTTFEEIVNFMKTTVNSEERGKKVGEFEEVVRKAHWEAQVMNCAHLLPFIRVVGRKEA